MVKKILIFFAINLAIALVAGVAPPSLTNGEDYLRVESVHEFIESVDPHSSVNVILGDSRSDCCLAAGDIGFVNLSYQGQSPVEGYYRLKRLTDRGVRVESLILSYGPFHIFTQDAFHSQTRYFGLIDHHDLDSVLDQAAELGDTEYLEYHWQALEVLDAKAPWLPDWLKFRLVNVASLHRTIAAIWRQLRSRVTDPEGRDSLRAHAQFKLYHAVPPDRVNSGAAAPESIKPDAVSPINELYLSKIVALARDHGMGVYFLVMPFNRDVEHPDHGYYERYKATLEKSGLEGCYSKARWWPNQLFADTHHLNVEGTSKMSAELRKPLSFCHW
jgi:hypothetical protein